MTDADPKALAAHRQEIDRLDRLLLQLLSERAAHAHAIGQLKGGSAVYRPEREAQILRRVAQENPGPLSEDAVQYIFRAIISACLALERRLRVAYLGPPGTFSHAAVERHFGNLPDASPETSIDEVFRAVEGGRADYAVVPVENSTEGAVGRTLDLMPNSSLKVCGEIEIRVQQNLLTRAPELKAIRRVYSHPQSFAQCQEWLLRHLPEATRLPVASNAEGARLAALDTEAAAIAGENAAVIYGLDVLIPHLEDEPNNTTRFWILGAQEVAPSGRDKTSLVLSAPNRPGAVYHLLEPFARNGVSMTRLESRPAKAGIWEYVFFVDVEGHQQDAGVALAIEELRQATAYVKVLGSYPVANKLK
ncbi:chorismate mutase / prephenate dehydratase [Burkholderiales bacterium]|nr:MAG: prephenate dehydratase [Burkholderiales bacterium]CAG0952176.1 chorismate mutase / prephenate dehydratase [Burkholderiales bacterium]